MYSYHDGRKIDSFLKEKRKGKEKEKPKKKKDGIWEAKIQWNSAHSYSGKLFKVNISYEIEKSDKSRMNRNDCFVFKCKGSTVVTFPTLPSTTPPPSTTEKSTTRKSTSTEKPTSTTEKPTSPTQKPTSRTEKPTSTTEKPTSTTEKPTSPTRKPTSTTEKPTLPTEKSTSTSISSSSMVPSPTEEILTTARFTRKAPNNTQPTRNTPRTRKPTDPEQPHVLTSEISSSSIAADVPENERQSSENEGNKMVYIIVAVVAIVTVIALAVIVRFVMIRKTKKKMLKKRESSANIIMSDINKNNINEDEDGLYTTLDKSTRNDESNYQALTLPGAKNKQPTVNAYNEKMHQIEGDYIHLDVDNVYSTIDPQINDRKVGAKSNDAFDANEDERAYSILEQYPNQIDYTTPCTGDERVYSILETEPGQIAYPTPSTVYSEPDYVTVLDNSDMDYVTVLPPKVEPGQSDCSVYADLSEQRAGENEYQSLVRRKK
ncbi:zonadhesin [Paramuricea clavata]|nr:zonadhesin [Paramuricea clavata]